MIPEEFYAQVERDNEDYRNERYQTYPGRYSDEWKQLKGQEEAAKYVMDVLYRVNPKSEHYLPPIEQDARRNFLREAAEDVKRKIGRLRQSQSQEREKFLIMADALEEYHQHMISLPWTSTEETEAYLKKRQEQRLKDLIEYTHIVEGQLSLAAMGMRTIRQTLEELNILKAYVKDEKYE